MNRSGIDLHHDDQPQVNPAPIPMVYVREDPKYEFKRIIRDLAQETVPDEAELNTLGDDGWKMAGMIVHEHQFIMIFQRQK